MAGTQHNSPETWLQTKLRNFYPQPRPETIAALERAVREEHAPEQEPPFENPFQMSDLLALDDETMQDILAQGSYGLTLEELASSLRGAPTALIEHIRRALPRHQQAPFAAALHRHAEPEQIVAAQKRLLDMLFWELTYRKMPELYEELTEGEHIHPGIFRQLAPDLRGKLVLDAGAGSGRATFECLRQGARHIYAVEPSPGLLRLLEGKLAQHPARQQITPLQGRFDALPLNDQSIDTSIACSAFTAQPEQGGERGLAELKRVTRPGGKIVIIWPRPEDYRWLVDHGFQYVALPMQQEPQVRFRSLQSALRTTRHFYPHKQAVHEHLLRSRQPHVHISLLSPNPPHDYCWLQVEER